MVRRELYSVGGTKMIEGTPAKLRSGAWGVRIENSDEFEILPGDMVKIVTRAGKTWETTIGKVVWSNEKVTLATTINRKGKNRA